MPLAGSILFLEPAVSRASSEATRCPLFPPMKLQANERAWDVCTQNSHSSQTGVCACPHINVMCGMIFYQNMDSWLIPAHVNPHSGDPGMSQGDDRLQTLDLK